MLELYHMQQENRDMRLLAAIVFSLLFRSSLGAEPQRPPDHLQPRQHFVEILESVDLRMGDSAALKDTDFSITLIGFSSTKPGGLPTPEFQYRQGRLTCADPGCARKLPYLVEAAPVFDRTAVRIRIVEQKAHL